MKIIGVLIPQVSKYLWMAIAATASFIAISSSVHADDRSPTVFYDRPVVLVEGDAPVLTSYVLSITSSVNVVGSTSITPVVALVSAPTDANLSQALGYVSLNPSTLIFSGPGVTMTTTVTSNVPVGAVAGDYQYKIATPGWPAGTIDPFALINMKLTVQQVPQRPSIAISSPANPSVYTYTLNGPAVSIPLQFTSTAPSYAPVLAVGADVSGITVTGLTSTGLGTGNVTSTGTINLSTPGIYTLSAHANNINGTSSTSAEITINLSAPAPTVIITNPAGNSSFTYTPGGPPLNVPFAFSAASAFGGIDALSATLNGTPVILTTTGLGTLTAGAGGNLQISSAGSYVLAVSAADRNGTTSATRSFTVSAATQTSAPTVTIAQPADGATFTRISGSAPLCIPFSFTAQATAGAKIKSLSASFNGAALEVTTTGIGKKSATGTGTLTVSAAGTYALTASANSDGTVGVDRATFTVVVTPPPPPVCSVNWLPPISLGKGQNGGCTVPIRFQIHCSSSHPDCDRDADNHHGDRDCSDDNDHHQNRDRDCRDGDHGDDNDHDCNLHETSAKILISEILSNGSASNPKIFSYGHGSSNYSIEPDDQYELDFDTARGKHVYHIDIYRFPNGGTTPQLIGTKEFRTN